MCSVSMAPALIALTCNSGVLALLSQLACGPGRTGLSLAGVGHLLPVVRVPELFPALFGAWPELSRFLGPPRCQGHGVCLGALQAGELGLSSVPQLSQVLAGSGGSQGGVRGAGAPWGWWLGSLPAGRGLDDSAGKGSVCRARRLPGHSGGPCLGRAREEATLGLALPSSLREASAGPSPPWAGSLLLRETVV